MPSPPSSPGSGSHVRFDWIDILLVFATLCGAFALAAALGTSDSSDLFKYGTAAAIIAVVVVRRAVSPPRVTAVNTRRSAFGIIGAACMIFGLVVASFGGSMFFDEWKRPVTAIRIDREAIDREIGLPALAPTCIRDGRQVRGRQCRTPEDIAKEAAADEQMYAEQIAQLEAEKRRRLSSTTSIAGVGVALVLVGIVLDILRTRRDKASETS